MSDSARESPDRFRLLATFIAGRSVAIAKAPVGQVAHTNGQVIFVSAGKSGAEQRREIVLQSALLGAGSLDQKLLRALRARPSLARRYLALEGRRAIAGLAGQLQLAATLRLDEEPSTATADESLELAKGHVRVADPPEWFGVIRPSRLLSGSAGAGGPVSDKALRLKFNTFDVPAITEADDDDDYDDDPFGESKILKLFENPLFGSQALSEFLRKLLGGGPSPGDGPAGAETPIRSVRRAREVGANARPLPTRIRFIDDGKPGAALGVGGALYPEWDAYNKRYRPEWCRVIDFPLTAAADVSDAGVPHDDVLRRRLSRIGLGPKILRGRPDGDEPDIEALIELFVDLRSGYSPPEHVYLERRKLARNLGVLILSMPPDPPPIPTRMAVRCTTTSRGPPPHWPSHSKNLATASPSTHFGPRADTLSTCWRSKRSDSVSVPSGEPG